MSTPDNPSPSPGPNLGPTVSLETQQTSAMVSTGHETLKAAPTGWMRWKICALLFFATTINYMDRQILGILAPDLQRSIGWTEVDYGNIIVAFQVAYAVGLLGAGAFMDRFG